ncbi:MAG TPA: adenine deaminase [Microcoleaceae cyanobacterium]
MSIMRLSGNIVDVLHRTIFPGTIWVQAGRIAAIELDPLPLTDQYILPGFIDAHIHIESSMLVPSEFARLATVHGTVATVSDPHEIANVLGLEGVRFMVANAAYTPMKIAFGAPSCVPATNFETAGATLTAHDIRQLLQQDHLSYLSEMMNFPGVLANDPAVMAKIQIAQTCGCPIDGHAPELRHAAARSYVAAGISTDHECRTLAEAEDKLALGMQILIREGSAAQNFAALHPLIASHPSQCMFCSDDRHPHDLVREHINGLVQRSVALGYDVMDVLQIACVNPVHHYGLKVGLLQVGDPADCIVVDNLQDFTVQATYCQGSLVAKQGQALLPTIAVPPINHFNVTEKRVEDFRLPATGSLVRVMTAIDGQLLTPELHQPAPIQAGEVVSDPEQDLLKIVVINRYEDAPIAIGLIKNFGLQRGAMASSVAHDSHNIVAVGVTDAELCAVVNTIIRAKGGVAVAEGNAVSILPLPIAGLMSAEDGYRVAYHYNHLNTWVNQLGSSLSAPFMTLSFMALLVIPDLKLSDRGLFDSRKFEFVPLWVE